MFQGNGGSLTCPICRTKHTTKDRHSSGFGENQYIVSALKKKVKEFTRCPEHNREMTFYCKDESCLTLICPRCQLRDHKMHNVVDIEEQKEENMKAFNEAKEVVDKGIKKWKKVKDIMIEDLSISLDGVEARRKHLKNAVDGWMDMHKKHYMRNHEYNMKMLKVNVDFLEDMDRRLRRMKEKSMNVTDGKAFCAKTKKLQDIKNGARSFSKIEGLTRLSFDWKGNTIKQSCGELIESEWFKETKGKAASEKSTA